MIFGYDMHFLGYLDQIMILMCQNGHLYFLSQHKDVLLQLITQSMVIIIVVSIVQYAIRIAYCTICIVSFEKSAISLIRIVGAYESDDTVVCIVRIVRIGCIGQYINNWLKQVFLTKISALIQPKTFFHFFKSKLGYFGSLAQYKSLLNYLFIYLFQP